LDRKLEGAIPKTEVINFFKKHFEAETRQKRVFKISAMQTKH
jgi:ribose 5-phosphate isomerase RpiB